MNIDLRSTWRRRPISDQEIEEMAEDRETAQRIKTLCRRARPSWLLWLWCRQSPTTRQPRLALVHFTAWLGLDVDAAVEHFHGTKGIPAGDTRARRLQAAINVWSEAQRLTDIPPATIRARRLALFELLGVAHRAGVLRVDPFDVVLS